ncbi:MAG: hypothetical protein U9O20_02640 [Patescibacteria group bacterium]|nr:hypothetical protein [Patescibacteria group bacterium]
MGRILIIRPLLFIAGGAATGFLSLVFSSVISLVFPSESGYFPLFVLVLVEEIAKFFGLTLLLIKEGPKISSGIALILFGALPFGLGFGLFEMGLILLSSRTIPSGALAIVVIHLITAVILSLAVYSFKFKKRESVGYVLILLAVLIHMWYNTFVISVVH